MTLGVQTVKAQTETEIKTSNTAYIQTGFVGAWVGAEWKVGRLWAIRTEAGLDFGLRGGDIVGETTRIWAPVFNVEPRFYYNLAKRASAGKNIFGNSGNFLAVRIDYHPDWFTISNRSDVNVIEQFQIIPKWGIRRHIGSSRFHYEVGIGVGYRHLFLSRYNINDTEDEVAVDLHLRIGYTF